MLDFGFSEIVLTSAIALVVLGPEKLPKVARQVGNWMGRARARARQLSEQLEREVNAEDLLRQSQKTLSPPKPMSPDPAPYDLSAFPTPLPSSTAPPLPAAEPTTFSSEPDQAPHGADWQPTPENKVTPNG